MAAPTGSLARRAALGPVEAEGKADDDQLDLDVRRSQTGQSDPELPITKAGNSHARRVLVEAAWHYRHRPAVGLKLRRRREGQPREIVAVADRAQRRLYRRFHRLVLASGKTSQQAVVAIARELVGFLWAALYLYPATQPKVTG